MHHLKCVKLEHLETLCFHNLKEPTCKVDVIIVSISFFQLFYRQQWCGKINEMKWGGGSGKGY